MLQKLWYDRTIRTQLLIAIGLINLCAALIAGGVSIVNARSATRVEMDASLELAKRFVRVTIEALATDGKMSNLATKINQLSSRLQVAHLRHVRIYIGDATGNLVQLSPAENTGVQAAADRAAMVHRADRARSDGATAERRARRPAPAPFSSSSNRLNRSPRSGISAPW